MTKRLVISGQAAEGQGALAGWRGQGSLTRAAIVQALADAGLPASLAPAAKSARAQAGDAVRRLNGRGFVVRAGKRTAAEKVRERAGERLWDARWIVSRSHAETAEVGDAAGQVVATFELWGDDLRGEGPGIVREVIEIFEALRDSEIYAAGDVTTWLQRVLYREMGATGYSIGHFVPAQHRASANALCAAMSTRWGRSWSVPLLPVATSDELRAGIARSLADDVAAISDSISAAVISAADEGRSQMTPGRAMQLLRSLSEVAERLAAYRPLCGEAAIAPIIVRLNELTTGLNALVTDTARRGAMLELDDAPRPVAIVEPLVEYEPPPAPAPAARPSYGFRAPRTSALPSNAEIAARRQDSYSVPAPAAEPPVEAPRSPLGDARAPLELD